MAGSATDFVKKAKEDQALRHELKAVDTSSKDAAMAGAVAIGDKHGYSFTADELEKALGRQFTDADVKTAAQGGTKVY